MKTKYIISLVVIVLIGLSFIFLTSGQKNFEEVNNYEGKITIFKSASCGCCGIYGKYFKAQNSNVQIVNTEDMDNIRDQHGVPSGLTSCHTTVIGDYFVEGHIPLEAVEKLLEEKPDIAGIAMPGMPSGSPGMPGRKAADFVIYAVNHDGSYDEYVRI